VETQHLGANDEQHVGKFVPLQHVKPDGQQIELDAAAQHVAFVAQHVVPQACVPAGHSHAQVAALKTNGG
jgi:hypothetical protein